MRTPLEGVRVLDLSRVLAGPSAGRLLCDLGADVVKVEPPEGDVTRVMGRGRPQTAYFTQQNVGKRSITVDFRTDEGCALVRRLAGVADVVLENFRPGVLGKFGLGWADLSALNPRLVMLSISGFGQEGPERDRAAYAGVIHAETGLTARQRLGDDGLPSDIGISMADTVTGLHGVVAILAALRHRDATGEGNHIDLALIDAMLMSDDYAPAAMADHRSASRKSRPAGADGASVPAGAAWEFIAAPGGPLIVMGEFKWIWKSINERLGVADPTPAGADVATKVAARRQAWLELVAGFDDRAELLATLDRANLAWGEVKTSAEAMSSPTVTHRGTIVRLDGDGDADADADGPTVIRAPYRFSNAASGVRGPAPRQDEHHDAVLADWLGSTTP